MRAGQGAEQRVVIGPHLRANGSEGGVLVLVVPKGGARKPLSLEDRVRGVIGSSQKWETWSNGGLMGSAKFEALGCLLF